MRPVRTYEDSYAYNGAVSPVLSTDFSIFAGVSGDISGKGLEVEGAGWMPFRLSLNTCFKTFAAHE